MKLSDAQKLEIYRDLQESRIMPELRLYTYKSITGFF